MDKLLSELQMLVTDVDGAVYRLFGDKKMYYDLLINFRNDNTIVGLKNAIKDKEWDNAFTAAHALKGLAGNLGLVPLFHSTGELVLIIRKGQIHEIDDAFESLYKTYMSIIKVIDANLID